MTPGFKITVENEFGTVTITRPHTPSWDEYCEILESLSLALTFAPETVSELFNPELDSPE